MPIRRVTSLDPGYRPGDLSVFPRAIDSSISLFEAINNAESRLAQNVTPASKYILLENASRFPEIGLIKISDGHGQIEKVFYARRVGNQLHLLQRGYGNTSPGHWGVGSTVSAPVMAEHHNALKDAIINIQRTLGLLNNPAAGTLHAEIRSLEQRWLAPKAAFRAFPKVGPPGLTVRLQNFSVGPGLRFLWDLGDGTTSTDRSPSHTYVSEGVYTIKLNVISDTGAASFAEKPGYIEITKDRKTPFFYATPLIGQSLETAKNKLADPTEFTFIDQTDGSITERHWFFGDDKDARITNPNKHIIKHTYQKPGEYMPSLLVHYGTNKISRITLTEGVTVV